MEFGPVTVVDHARKLNRKENAPMLDSLFEAFYVIGLVAGSVIRTLHTRQYKQRKMVGKRETVVDKVLLVLASLGLIVVPSFYLLSPWLDFADYNLPAWAGWVGAGVFGVALWLLWRSHVDLGRNSVTLSGSQPGSIACYPRCVPAHPASDVRCPLVMGNRSSVVAAELDRRLGPAGGFPASLPEAGSV